MNLWLVSISQATMLSWDTIQLVISAGNHTILIPDIITTYASPLY